MSVIQLNLRDRRRKIIDRLMLLLLVMSAFFAVIPLLFVFYYVMSKALPHINLEFFYQLPVPVGESGGGMGNAVMGTMKLLGIASIVGIPWGIFIGIYLSEYGKSKTANAVRFFTDLFTSVPSIIIGLFVYGLIVKPMGSFSGIAGGLSLAVIMIPIIGRSTEEILKLTPIHIREAGLALGLSRRKVIIQIVLRGSASAVFTGVLLAIARASGETAPLLFTALNNSFWSNSLLEPMASLPVQIFTYAVSPFEEWQNQAWVGAFVLVFFVFGVNLLVRIWFNFGVKR